MWSCRDFFRWACKIYRFSFGFGIRSHGDCCFDLLPLLLFNSMQEKTLSTRWNIGESFTNNASVEESTCGSFILLDSLPPFPLDLSYFCPFETAMPFVKTLDSPYWPRKVAVVPVRFERTRHVARSFWSSLDKQMRRSRNPQKYSRMFDKTWRLTKSWYKDLTSK